MFNIFIISILSSVITFGVSLYFGYKLIKKQIKIINEKIENSINNIILEDVKLIDHVDECQSEGSYCILGQNYQAVDTPTIDYGCFEKKRFYILEEPKNLNLTMSESGIINKYDMLTKYITKLKIDNMDLYMYRITILYNNPPPQYNENTFDSKLTIEKIPPVELFNKIDRKIYEKNKNITIFENKFTIKDSICQISDVKDKIIHSYLIGNFNNKEYKILDYKNSDFCIYQEIGSTNDNHNYFITLDNENIYFNTIDNNELPSKVKNITLYLHFIQN